MNVSTFPPPSLSIQLLELKREKKMRAGVYPHWVSTGKIKQSVADYQCNALDGAIATMEKLTAAEGQPGRKEITETLRSLLFVCKAERFADSEEDWLKVLEATRVFARLLT